MSKKSKVVFWRVYDFTHVVDNSSFAIMVGVTFLKYGPLLLLICFVFSLK